jgi:hypothetical protein
MGESINKNSRDQRSEAQIFSLLQLLIAVGWHPQVLAGCRQRYARRYDKRRSACLGPGTGRLRYSSRNGSPG